MIRMVQFLDEPVPNRPAVAGTGEGTWSAPTSIGAGPDAPTVTDVETDELSVRVDFDDAFEELHVVAMRTAFRFLGNEEDARDIAQETMARVLNKWATVAPYRVAFTARVAGDLAIDQLRRRHRRNLRRHLVARRDEHVDRDSAQTLDLLRALATLPKRQREVVVLRYLSDQSEADVARVLGCSEGTVKSSASRGLASLRVQLETRARGDHQSERHDGDDDE